MIRVMLVDDHPALRAGLEAVLKAESGLIPVGSAATESELWPLLHRTSPDVVVMDYHLPEENGFVLCHRVKKTVPAPKVLLYSTYAGASFTLPAVVAGADGVVNKGAPALELFAAVRAVANGEKILPEISPDLLVTAKKSLSSEYQALVDAIVTGKSLKQIAAALGIEPKELSAQIEQILRDLQIDVPGSEGTYSS